MDLLVNVAVVLATVAVMEAVAYSTHRWVMHGPLGWGWHKSHHEPHDHTFERNDLYAIVFTVLSGGLIAAGILGVWPLRQVGIGMMIYGILYFIVHDGLVHQRWPFRFVARHGYLKRLVQAHKLHHAVDGRDGCVSFGFLYAPPVAHLSEKLKQYASVRAPKGRRPSTQAEGAAK